MTKEGSGAGAFLGGLRKAIVRHEQLAFRTLALTTVLSLLIGAFTIWQLVLVLQQLQVAP